jgi:hypothetical protein
MEAANVADVLEILNEHVFEVFQKLNLSIEDAQLSLPLDSRGPRIKVSVRPGRQISPPSALSFNLSGRHVQVPVETAADFQDYILH